MINYTKHLSNGETLARHAQVGGDHYSKMGDFAPLNVCLQRHGFEAFRGACLVKIDKYLSRDKVDMIEDYGKAQHVLAYLKEETIKEYKSRQS